MTEILAILGTGIAIISVILAGQRGLRTELDGLRTEQHELRKCATASPLWIRA